MEPSRLRSRSALRPEQDHELLAALLAREDFAPASIREGQPFDATIVAIGEHDVVVDIGAKRDGIVPPSDLDLVGGPAYVRSLRVGDRVPVVVVGQDDEGILVSISEGRQQRDWIRAGRLEQSGDVVEAEVVGSNRGGVLVEFGQIQGFVPNSHLTSIQRGLRGPERREAKEALAGRTLQLVVLEVDTSRRRLVLSERAAQKQKRARLLDELAPGQVRAGVVQDLLDFGAFVDLGGIDGLIHISELDRGHVNHPSEVLSPGDQVEVYVLGVDPDRERVSLSRKRLQPDPWNAAAAALTPGEVREAIVTGVQEYGAFADVGNGLQGLIHVSKMPNGQAMLAGLEAGNPILVRVLGIDAAAKQIELGLELSLESAPSPEGVAVPVSG